MEAYENPASGPKPAETPPVFASPWFALYLAFRNGMRRVDVDSNEDKSSETLRSKEH